MNKRSCLTLWILLILFSCQNREKQPAVTAKSNILFIAIDDLNDWIGCLGGHPQAQTPNIDRLAKQGVLFTNAHCAVPICGPSRSSIFIGRQPWNTGIYTNDNTALKQVGRKYQTLLQDLRKAGYNTYGAGKLFHGNLDAYPVQEMFTEYGNKYQKWTPFTPEEVRYTDEEYNSDVPKSVLKHRMSRGNGKLSATFPLNKLPRERRLGNREIDSFDWGALDVDDSEMGDYVTAEWGIQKLNQDHSKPFFLGVGFYRPHIPLFVPEKYYQLFPPDKVKLPEFLENDLKDIPQVAKDMALKAYTAGTHQNVVEHGQWREAVSCYLACVNFVDTQIGRVLDALEQSPYRDNTTIVLWSDHGFHLGEKEHWGKFTGWEESTRVPLIIVPPKKRIAEFSISNRCNSPVSLIDLYPTILDMINLERSHELDGKSLVPFLKNAEAGNSDYAITTFGRGNHNIRLGDWNYIHYYDGSEELYNVIQDPNEYDNLAMKEAYKDELNSLRGKLPAYEDVAHFISMDTWKAVIYKDGLNNELFNFEDNKAVPENKNVASEHPEIIEKMLLYIKEKQLSEKYISIPKI